MEAETYYHIYTHANGSENLFRNTKNYLFFLKRYITFIPSIANTYAYCLMPNHIHFLIRVKSEKEIEKYFGKFETFQKLSFRISKQFANLFSSYTQAYNKVYSRKGSLFIPNFKKKEITSVAHLIKIIHYIHANPVHHGFTKAISQWQWSSHHAFLSQKSSLLKRDEVYEWFGGKDGYEDFHQKEIIHLKK